MHSDVLIVGAGSAGCVLAEQLSRDPQRRVTVVEAGPGPADPRVSEQISDGLRLPIGPASSVVRRYETTLTDEPRRRAWIMRGAVVGGSGAVNGGYFCRGLPADFDGWGVPGWSWTDVLPHFRAIERDLDFDGPLHGSSGPMVVRRVSEMDTGAAVFVDQARRRGYPWVPDLNGEDGGRPGVGAVPLNVDRGTRVGPGGAFPRTRHTPPQSHRVGDVAGAAPSDRSEPGGRGGLRHARRAAAADGGPGGPLGGRDRLGAPADALGDRAGCAPQRRGHPGAGGPAGGDPQRRPSRMGTPGGLARRARPPPLEAVLTTADGTEIRAYTTGFASMMGADDDPTDRPHLGVTLMRPRSRGRVTLTSADPESPPSIEHRYDSEAGDVAALAAGADLAHELAGSGYAARESFWSTSQHLCGTVPMGPDGEAPLDERCRVRGVDGLWVVDGSILPDITSRGPHATIVMIGHRAAEFIR